MGHEFTKKEKKTRKKVFRGYPWTLNLIVDDNTTSLRL